MRLRAATERRETVQQKELILSIKTDASSRQILLDFEQALMNTFQKFLLCSNIWLLFQPMPDLHPPNYRVRHKTNQY